MDKIIINIITNGKEDLNTYNYDYDDEDYCDYDEEYDEYDEEPIIEDELEELLQDTLDEIENGVCDCDECIHEKIMQMLQSAYEMGYNDGFEDA